MKGEGEVLSGDRGVVHIDSDCGPSGLVLSNSVTVQRVHHGLKHGGGVSEAKEHHSEFIEPSSRLKRRFVFILCLDADVVVPPSYVQLCIDHGPSQVSDQCGDEREQVLVVMTPLMVGSTWLRVRSTLGSDCLPALSQGTISLYLFMDLLIVIFLSLRAHVRCPMSGDLGVVLVRFIHLLIMRVGARSHGTLYPMTGCVLYLGRLLCW